MNKNYGGLDTATNKTGNKSWKKLLGPFPDPIGDIRSMKHQQERVEDDDKVIIGFMIRARWCDQRGFEYED